MLSIPNDAAATYRQQGYYFYRQSVLPPELLDASIQAMDDVRNGVYETGLAPEDSPWTPGAPLDRLCKIEMPQFANRTIAEIVGHANLGRLAAAITGAQWVQAWWVQLLIKPSLPPGQSAPTAVGWHQDLQYWDAWEEDSELFTAWVALSDVTIDAGPVRFVPGSHTWGLQDFGDFYEQNHGDQVLKARVPEGHVWQEEAAVLPPGGVSFHHKLNMHASGHNTSGHPRRSFAIHLRTEKSTPKDGVRQGLAKHIDDLQKCPVLFGG
ncbi:MAG: phytanoyl-CoA dioxygenase family protein [Candidatus Hydrogenedentes bacterium]|nr:phytanoyl-CoA dioxygenase family protein [Candidatus Hydrogenedentota bacterium]